MAPNPRIRPDDDRPSAAAGRGAPAAAPPGPRPITWAQAGIEPSIGEMLNDPIVVALMRRDRITAEQIEATIRDVTRRRRMAHIGGCEFPS